MIELEQDIRDVEFELSEIDQKIVSKKSVSFNELLDLIDNLNYELDNLKDEYNNFKDEVEENYRQISQSEQYGVSDRDFIEVL